MLRPGTIEYEQARAQMLTSQLMDREQERDKYRKILEQIYDGEIGFQSVEDVRSFVLSSLRKVDSDVHTVH